MSTSIFKPAAGTLLLALAIAPAPAEGQRVIPGFARIDQSDVAGVSVTSSDLLNFEPGTVKSLTCPVAWGVRTTSEAVASSLASGDFRVAAATVDGTPVSEPLRRDLLLLLTDADGSDAAGARIAAALGRDDNRGARDEARQLVRSLKGLVAAASRMDPARPGVVAPMKLNRSVADFNDFVDDSSPTFLANPPEELGAVQSVLSRIVISALENEGRVVDADAAPAGALACAPPAEAAPVAVVVPEVAIAMCVMRPEGPVEVAGVVNPATGDTVAIVAGERRPFSEVGRPTVTFAANAPWYARGEPIAFGRDRYVRYGLPTEMAPNSVMRVGEYEGVPVYARTRALRPDAIFVPAEAPCTFQEYRRVEEVMRVRG